MQPSTRTPQLAAAALAVVGVGMATAGTTGTEFQGMYTLLQGWGQGFLGKGVAIFAFVFGAGIGFAKQSVLPAVIGMVFALFFAVGPGAIDGMLSATV